MNHVILVKRSSGGSYHVEFIKDKSRLRVRCNCSLGSIGQICRHKRALIQGSTKMLYQDTQDKLLQEILAWPEMRILSARAKKYEIEMAEIESQITALSKEVQVIKHRFASDCLDGVHDS